MDERWTPLRAAIRTAATLSAIAVVAAIVVDSVVDVSRTVLVLASIVVGFVVSMVVTERAARSSSEQLDVFHVGRGHRVTVLPVGHRVA